MFSVSQTEAAMIRAAYERGGEPAAAATLRRLFPGMPDNAEVWACIWTIMGWPPALADRPD